MKNIFKKKKLVPLEIYPFISEIYDEQSNHSVDFSRNWQIMDMAYIEDKSLLFNHLAWKIPYLPSDLTLKDLANPFIARFEQIEVNRSATVLNSTNSSMWA